MNSNQKNGALLRILLYMQEAMHLLTQIEAYTLNGCITCPNLSTGVCLFSGCESEYCQ